MLYHAFSFVVYLLAIYYLGTYVVDFLSPEEWLAVQPAALEWLDRHFFINRFVNLFFYFLEFLLYMNLFVLFFTPYRYLTVILMSPFLGFLAEKLYLEKMGKKPESQSLSGIRLMGRSMKLNAGLFFTEFGLNFLLFFVRFFDISFFSYLASFFMMAYFAGLSYMDFGLELYGKPAKETRSFVWDYKFIAIMVGLVYASFLLFPILGFLLAPLFGLTLGVNSVINVEEDVYEKILPKRR